MDMMKCPSCQNEIPANSKFCPECGASLVNIETTATNHPKNEPCTTVQGEGAVAAEAPSKRKTSKKGIIALLVLIIVAAVAIYAYNTVLWGNDKIAFDLVKQYAYSFKNPSSVRVVSGTAGESKTDNSIYAFLRISATNGFGATTTGYYYFGSDHMSDLEADDEFLQSAGIDVDNSYMYELCDRQNVLNVDKINHALAKTLK